MILLDTNVLSALMQRVPDPKVIAWLNLQPRTSVWTSAISILEVHFGLQILEPGKKRDALTELFDLLIKKKIERRVAAFDMQAADQTATLMALRQQNGRPGELRDSMIAGIALATRATLATRNTRHFEDLPLFVVNPWQG